MWGEEDQGLREPVLDGVDLMALDWGKQPKHFVIADTGVLRKRQSILVEEAVVYAEMGNHIHFSGGGTVWCNLATPCAGTRDISDLLLD